MFRDYPRCIMGNDPCYHCILFDLQGVRVNTNNTNLLYKSTCTFSVQKTKGGYLTQTKSKKTLISIRTRYEVMFQFVYPPSSDHVNKPTSFESMLWC
ncbi:hypothetical protein NQ317_012311 [Molorchus minor]|uniref:Uncharacterized protein n=1 Tax=Molorchus minor TaxID=1323400 RepID=A0ABQ9IUD3_9CUCU|nr:hypothetical protein NQ317_012311 [Molorchus minor]